MTFRSVSSVMDKEEKKEKEFFEKNTNFLFFTIKTHLGRIKKVLLDGIDP